MAATTIAFVMGTVEPHVEAWHALPEDVCGGMMVDSMVPLEWQNEVQYDNDDNELNIGWINPQTLMQEHAVELPLTACPDVLACDSSLSSIVEAQWLDTSHYVEMIDNNAVAVVPDDFIVTCHQAATQANSTDQSDQIWLEDLDDVDSFLKQLEDEQVGSESDAGYFATTTTSKKAEGSVSCSQLEMLLRCNDIAPSSSACSEVDTDVDVEFENNTNDSLPDETESDGASDDSDWSYSGKKHRRRSSGRKRTVRKCNNYSQVTCISASSLTIRKKEQNKNAATRYRERKRTEEQDNEAECLALEKRNKELRTRVSEMTHEVTVLRQLVVDIFRSSSV